MDYGLVYVLEWLENRYFMRLYTEDSKNRLIACPGIVSFLSLISVLTEITEITEMAVTFQAKRKSLMFFVMLPCVNSFYAYSLYNN